MADLAYDTDVIDRLGRGLTTVEAIRLVGILHDASAAVRRYIPQEIEAGTSTVTLKVRRGKVRLPQRPVNTITTVVDENANPVLYTILDDVITVSPNVPDTWAWVPWANGYQTVTVTYTHGYATIPDDIIGVVCSIAIRALGRKPEDSGITNESIQGYSYSLGTAGAAGGFGMLPDEKAILDVYKREGSYAQVGL